MVGHGSCAACAIAALQVSHERVRNSLKRQGLRPVYKRPYRVTTDSDHHNPVAPNVLDRRFDGWRINQAWVGDITYVETAEGWLYLACVMDLASRRIVGWSMSDRMKTDLVSQALKSAYGLRQTGCRTDHAYRPWQPVRQRHSPTTDQRLPNGSIDEPESQLLGQCRNGELLQDSESRTHPSNSLRNTRAGETRYRRLDRRLLQSTAHPFVDRLQDTSRRRVPA